MIRAFLLTAALLALTACAPGPGASRVSAGTTVDIASAGTQLSVQRAGAGIIRPLVHSPQLQAAAQAQADDLHATGRFDHTGRDGSTLSDRMGMAGYTACFAAENIARGQPDIRSVVATWMASEGHRGNILNPQATQFGFANTGDVWVLVLGRPC